MGNKLLYASLTLLNLPINLSVVITCLLSVLPAKEDPVSPSQSLDTSS